MLLAFVPMLFISFAYNALNTARAGLRHHASPGRREAFGPRAGWMSGWGIIAADVIVMANLAQIAGMYTLPAASGRTALAENTVCGHGRSAASGSLVMTWICYRGIELSARTQYFLLGAELIMLAALRGGRAGRRCTAATRRRAVDHARRCPGSTRSRSADVQRAVRRASCSRCSSTGAGTRGRGQRGDRRPGRHPRPGGGAVDAGAAGRRTLVVTVAAQAYAGVGEEGIGLANPENTDDVLAGVGEAVLGSWRREAADRGDAHVGGRVDPDHDPADRPDDAVDGGLQGAAARRSRRSTRATRRRPSRRWAMGVVSIVFYVGADADLSADVAGRPRSPSIGLLIAFYYGLTGFASASGTSAASSTRSGKDLLLKGMLPLLGGADPASARSSGPRSTCTPTDFGETVLQRRRRRLRARHRRRCCSAWC